MEQSFPPQSYQESLRRVAEGKLSPCLEIIFNAKIPAQQALRIIAQGTKAAAQATHLKPRYHRLFCHKLGLIGVMLEFPGKSAVNRMTTINIDFIHHFAYEVRDQIESFDLMIVTARDEMSENLFGEKDKSKRDKGDKVGLYISSRFIPSYKYQTAKKITKRVFKMGRDEFMLVYDRSYGYEQEAKF